MAKKGAVAQQANVTPQIQKLLDFWEEVMNGSYDTADKDGNVKRLFIPIELRLRASELLAKYTVPGKIRQEDDGDITTTPDILKLAQMLESNAQFSDDDIREALAAIDTEGD